MYDKSLALDIAQNILDSVNKIIKRSINIKSPDDFLRDDNSMIILDSICMQLIAIGQGVKDLDKVTNKKLLIKYPNIPWRNIAGIRDVLSHNYFNLNAETVFGILDEDIIKLKNTLEIIIEDLRKHYE